MQFFRDLNYWWHRWRATRNMKALTLHTIMAAESVGYVVHGIKVDVDMDRP